MNKFIFLLFIMIQFNLESVEFVLFTQPKTATYLLIPILTELTKKNVYWAPEYKDHGELLVNHTEASLKNPECFLFNLRKCWSRQTMDLVWETTRESGTFLHLHAPFSQTMENFLIEKKSINFFIKRDPRDQIVSLLNHYKYIQLNDTEIQPLQTDDEKLLFMIRKESRYHTIHYMNWLNSSVCCILDFEKLMGNHGGVASQAHAIEEMRKIATALQMNLSDAMLINLYQKHFGKGWSFFRGKVGTWKDYFNETHKVAIKEEIGDLLIQLGYEKDFKW